MRTSALLLKLVAATVLLALQYHPAVAQSSVDALQACLIGQPLLLRGFWLDDSLHFDSNGKPLETYKTGSFTESAFDAKTLTLKDDRLTIDGQRVGIFFDEHGNAERLPMTKPKLFGRSPEKVTIQIDGQGNPDFGKELDAIFGSHLYEIAASLPEFWQPFAHKHFVPPDQLPSPPVNKATSTVMKISDHVMRPKVLYQTRPVFSETARQMSYSGNAVIYLWVGTDGLPSHISISKPTGLGLDEKAVAAVSKYRFSPATRDGKPVTVDLYVDVNFQIL
ncbi:MAG: energy transducer TonB [Acidobacteriaceae bacterium]